MKLSKNQLELLEKLKVNRVMYWNFYQDSPTQFKINTAEALERKGLVNLKFLGHNDTQYELTLAT